MKSIEHSEQRVRNDGAAPEMKVRIERDDLGVHRIFAQRAKFKHWFELGAHKPTDKAFAVCLRDGTIQWPNRIERHDILFKNLEGV